MKRKLASMMSCIMALSLTLTACGSASGGGGTGASDSATASSDSTTASDSAAAPADGREMVGNMYTTGLPIAKETGSFTLLLDGGNVTDLSKLPMVKALEDQTNIKVDYLSYPYEVATEKVNILLNSGEYPDAFGGWITPDPVRYGQKEKILIPLEEMFSKYAPNVETVLNLQGIKNDITLPDGHIYCPPYVVGEPQLVFGPWINKKWLDNLGLPMPKTTDDLYNTLVAFRDKDPNKNGKKDEIPLTSRADHFYMWSGLFGAPAQISLVGGQIVYGPMEKGYKDAMKYFRKLYTEKLIDPELFTQDANNYNDKNKGTDAIYGVPIAYNPADFSPGLDANGMNIRADEYVPFSPITNSEGDKPVWRRQGNGTTLFATQFAITDKAKNPEMIVRWLDNLYSLDNSIQAKWGMYDVTLKKTADGKYEDLPKTDVTGSPNYKEFFGPLPKYVPADVDALKVKSPAAKLYDDQNNELDAAWADNMTERMPRIYFTEEENAKTAPLVTDLNNYISQKRAAWISGEGDIDGEWDAYLAQLDKLGLKTYLEIYKAAYDRTVKK